MSEVIGTVLTSGQGDTSYSDCLRSVRALYLKSPRALETPSVPLTRLSWMKLPALVMRLCSLGHSGLWSLDRSMARPSSESTVRESPALAQMISLFVMRTTVAVQPPQPSYVSLMPPFSF